MIACVLDSKGPFRGRGLRRSLSALRFRIRQYRNSLFESQDEIRPTLECDTPFLCISESVVNRRDTLRAPGRVIEDRAQDVRRDTVLCHPSRRCAA